MTKIDSKIFTEDFVKLVTEEVRKQVENRTDKPVTRKSIISALGFEKGKQQLAAENVLSLIFSMGLITGYKTSRRAGIRSTNCEEGNG